MSQDTHPKGTLIGAAVASQLGGEGALPPATTGVNLVQGDDRPTGIAPLTAAAAMVGATIDNRYRVESVLGEGGMGVVYGCRHKIIDKKVAMKVLRADMARDREATERFLTEAKAASAIGHEHIIDISDFGNLADGSTYFVMEYLDGQPLSKVVQGQQPVPLPRLLHIARQLGEGLAAAHDAGIIHRDLKPDNIFLIPRGTEKDFVKILDFGIAKVSTNPSGQLTRAGSVFGTPHYMSPEQAAGAPVDHRGDIYSFGVILYELSSGKVPFDADNFMGILTQHMYKAPVPIRALVPPPEDVPPGLEAIVLKCLSKRPEQRYQTMREVTADLDRLRDGQVPVAVSEMMARSGGFNVPADFFKGRGMPAPVPATPLRGGRPAWPLVAGVAGVGVAIGLVVAIFSHPASSPGAPASSGAVAAVPMKGAEPAPPVPAVAPAPAQATHAVVIAAEPLDALVFQDDRALGSSPVVVNVPEGGTVDVEIRHSGYATKKIVLDGTEAKLNVKLDRDRVQGGAQARAKVPPSKPEAPAPRPRPRSSIGGGEIVNPWAR